MKHSPLDRRSPAPLFVAAAALTLVAAGCSSRSSGTPIPAAPGVVGEIEPNDSSFDANFLGQLFAGDRVRIFGRMSAVDLYDGFAFIATEPLSVRFVLSADNPAADLDVCIYDPYLDAFVDCFEAPGDLETGVFDVLDAGAEFHIVVTPFAGVSDYELEIVASCCAIAPPAALQSEPAAVSERGIERLDGYTRSAREAPADEPDDEDVDEPTVGRGVLIEVDAAGRIEAEAVGIVALDGAGGTPAAGVR